MGVTYVKEVMSPRRTACRVSITWKAQEVKRSKKMREIAKVFTGESDKF